MMKRLAIDILILFLGLLTISFVEMDTAEAYIELNGFYSSESLTAGTNATNSRMFFDFSIGFAVDKKARYLVGWNYSMHSAADGTSTTQTYSSTQMGPRFIWFVDKDNSWSLGLGYYLVTNATFDSGGGTTEKWKGTAIKADFGYNFAVGSQSYAGIRLNYSMANYNEKLVGETTYSTVSYSKTAMYPSIYYIFVF